MTAFNELFDYVINLYGEIESAIMAFFETTPPEVLIGLGSGIGAAGIAAMVTNYLQERKADVFPVLPSNIDSIGYDDKNETVRFYAAVNDLTMSVNNAWNDSRIDGGKDQFLYNIRQDPNIRSAISAIKDKGKAIKAELSEYVSLEENSAFAGSLFDNSWSYWWHDEYRTEYYTETERDSDGNTQEQSENPDESMTIQIIIGHSIEKMQPVLKNI